MANDLNSCNFIGRLGNDPEMRYSANGDAIASFSIAVGWKSKDKDGKEWVNISAFGKLAEICGQYLKKGSQVYVSGKMKTDKYTDKNGVEKYSTKIILANMQMLGVKHEANKEESKPHKPGSFDEFEDDIPF